MRFLSSKALLGGVCCVLLAGMLFGAIHTHNAPGSGTPLVHSEAANKPLSGLAHWIHARALQVQQEVEGVYSYSKARIAKTAAALRQAQASLAHADQAIRELDTIDLSAQTAQVPLVDTLVTTYNRIIDNPLQRYLTHVKTSLNSTNEHFFAVHEAVAKADRYVLEWGNRLTGSKRQDSSVAFMTMALLLVLAIALLVVFKTSIYLFMVRPFQRAYECNEAELGDSALNDGQALTVSIEEHGSTLTPTHTAARVPKGATPQRNALDVKTHQLPERIGTPAHSATYRQPEITEPEV